LGTYGLETTIFGYSGSSPKPDKIVGPIESGLTEIYCNKYRFEVIEFVTGDWCVQ